MVKFNVDGFSRGNPGPIECRGVLRDCDGIIVALFSGPTGIHDLIVAKLLAILTALDVFLKSKKFVNMPLVIESDSTLATNWCTKEALRPWRL
ncbi:hypothetical protein REPUB_Repub13aG0146200 [Reevesia pubescens]